MTRPSISCWDAIVVGLGGVGSFALRSLSRQTKSVLGLERFTRGHAKGSSHGGSRIYRRAYFEHSNYVPLIEYSIREFQALQQQQDDSFMEECGTLILEEQNGPVIASCTHSARQHGIKVELLSSSELRERYPQFCYKGDKNDSLVGLLEPGGGFVRPERAMEAALAQAEANGASVWEETQVLSIKEIQDDAGADCVEVKIQRSNDGTEVDILYAKSVIVSAGSWAGALVPSWESRLNVTRQVQGWLSVSLLPDSELYNPCNMPTWYYSSPKKSALPIYGIPADPRTGHGIKMGIHLRDVIVDPNKSLTKLNDAEWKELRTAAQCALAQYNEMTFEDAKPCLYTMSPDGHFWLGPPAGSKRIFAAAGLSGHGFKMTPALGQILADWALDLDTREDCKVDFLSPSRFGL